MWWAEADLLAHIGDICESEENRAELEEQEVEGTKEHHAVMDSSMMQKVFRASQSTSCTN
jgi:hypothetical protein